MQPASLRRNPGRFVTISHGKTGGMSLSAFSVHIHGVHGYMAAIGLAVGLLVPCAASMRLAISLLVYCV